MDRVPLLGGFVQLAVLALIVWAVVRASGRGRRSEETGNEDGAAALRRLFVYGFLFSTLMLTATGAVLALQEMVASDRSADDRSSLALGLALVIVAGPTYGLLLRHARGRLDDDRNEAGSFAWAAYLNFSLFVALVVTTVSAQQMLEGLIGVDAFEADTVVPVAVWGAIWGGHWFWLKAVHGLPGDLHLAAGSLTGLITLVIGAGGLVFAAGDEIYVRVVHRVPVGHADPDVRGWIIAASLGAVIWWWHWMTRYRTAERTPLWHVYVVLVGALGGLVAAVVSAATIGYRTLVWFVGDPHDRLSSTHFEFVPVATAVFAVGAAVWWYHRVELRRQPDVERTDPLRAYDYLMAAAGMVAAVVGATLAFIAVIEQVTPEPDGTATGITNRLILAGTLLAIGGPLWWTVWSRIRRHVDAEPGAELASAIRRIHLIVVFGIGGIVVLVSLITVVFVAIEDLLGGTFGGDTVRSLRVGSGLVVTVTGVAWYHFLVFRSDRGRLALLEPASAPSRPRLVILVAPRSATFAAELAAATGARVDSWSRAEEEPLPLPDVELLAAMIEATDGSDTLVMVDEGGPHIIPISR